MARQTEAKTRREWLEQQRPVTVLDIRTDQDREQWSIPGSIHVNAYEALRQGEISAFLRLPDRWGRKSSFLERNQE